MNEILNDFIIRNGTNVNAMESETLEQQTNGPHNDFENFDNSLSQSQVIKGHIDDRIRNAVDNAVVAVGNRMHDAILTAMNNADIPRVDMAVRSITGSSGNGTNGVVQNPDVRDCTGISEKTPLRSFSSMLDSNFEQDEIDEARDIGISEDGDFPLTKLNYDRRAHAHYNHNYLIVE